MVDFSAVLLLYHFKTVLLMSIVFKSSCFLSRHSMVPCPLAFHSIKAVKTFFS